jgi:alanine dehydrogenase
MNAVLVLSQSAVARLLDLDTCIEAVAGAFRLHAEGKALPPGVLGVPNSGGGFHLKAAGLRDYRAAADSAPRTFFAAKLNANFATNPGRGLPRIQGVLVLCDGDDGTPLAVMDSIEITRVRTAAASAVAARALANPDSRTATVCGCGVQGRAQLAALARVLPLETVHAYDVDPAVAHRFASEMGEVLGIEVLATTDLASAVRASAVCVTATPAREWFLSRHWMAPGTFVAAVGADWEDKRELDPELLATSTLVVDLLDQCATVGELHHALREGALAANASPAELGDVLIGKRPGRTRAEEVIVFDSTGTALQDVAAAVAVYERARRESVGLTVEI